MKQMHLFLLSTLALCMSCAHAQSYFVGPTGLDTNPGTSGLPFREIRKGLAVAVAGDTINVADGQYKGFDVSGKVGTLPNPITIKATGTGAVVNVTTDRSDNRDTMFVTNGSTYVIIDGLTSFNANRAALRVDQCAHITVRNCIFGNCTVWGMFTDFSDFLLIENNECYGSVQQHGCYVSNTCTGPIVRGNKFHDNCANGLHMNGDVSQGGAGIITNALVEKNIIYNNGAGTPGFTGGGSAINCDGVQSSLFQNNLCYNCHGAGMSLYIIDASQPSINNVVVNNTFDVASNGKWAFQLGSDGNGNGSTGNIVFNNIFISENAGRGSIHMDDPVNLTGFVCDYNVLTTHGNCVTVNDDASDLSFAGWQGMGYGTHSITSTQASLFVNAGSGDYHLKTGSPAIDIGISTLSSKSPPTVDIEGNTRPNGAGYDIGSYEYQSPVLTINTPSPLPAGTVGTAYSQTITATGGITPYTWSITSGTLQAGLNFNTSTGAITGTPTASGPVSITVQVKDNVAATASKVFSLTITPTLTISTSSPLTAGTVNSFYTQTFTATGGTPAYTWALNSGTLPNGLTLNTSTGVLSGTPTLAGPFSFTLKVTDSVSGTATKTFSLTINNIPVTITTTSPLPGGTVNVAYSKTIVALGGSPAYTWSLSGGTTLPPGLTLSAATGVISGTPTTPGTTNFTLKVTDSLAASTTQAFALTIAPPTPVLTTITVTPASATVGATKTQQYSATGIDQFGNALTAQPTFTWSVSGGGTISSAGLFTAAGPFGTYSVTGTSGAIKGSASVKVTVPPTVNSPPSSSTNPVVVNVPVTFTAGATDPAGGTVTYQWNFGDGSTATGASPTHTYTATGAYTITVTITNSTGDVTTATLNVTVVSGTIPMTVTKMQGVVKFTAQNADSVSVSGIVPKLPALFDPIGQTLVVNVSGATATFKLDGKGHAKSAQGGIALKFKPTKRNKTTKKLDFLGGDVAFAFKLQKGTWAADWGMSGATSVTNSPLPLTVTIQLAGNTYAATVTVKYTAKAKVGGKFKK